MTTIYFKSNLHRERLQEAIQKTDKTYDGGKVDAEYGSALYILTSMGSMWQKTRDSVDRDGIGFEEILHEVNFSGGEERLIRLAGNLFNNEQHIDPVEFVHLDGANFQVALQAMKIRRDGLRLADLSADTNPHQLSDGFIKAVTGTKVEVASIETEVQEPAIVRGYYPSEDAMATGHVGDIRHDDDTHEVFFFMENTTIEKTIKDTGAIHYRFPDGCVLILHDGMARTEEEVKAERDELAVRWKHPNTMKVSLHNGQTVETEVNGKSFDGKSGSILLNGKPANVVLDDGQWKEL